ncbi:rod shape-determining protein MreD [Anaerobacterium chartisolvens]|uniref:Rod shape-determining protein MreD n=1 Tax=Anaerobacterium chartisolvens TaxID=1297424 RepID=A0A369BGX9_9FIRM|nr:rod shape-determining protein MreD [Anaerobacterium chartisolvens]RCX20809.1 rod shape-determining protein MreD [Anaerobacterium chartisolvens]
MRVTVLIYSACITLLILIQSTVLDYIKVFNVKPNLLIVAVITVALLRGNVEGAVVGFVLGLLQDASSGKILGFYSLLGMYLGLIVGSVNKRLYRENFFVMIFFTFISSILYEETVYILLTISKGNIDFVYSLKNIVFPEAVYNSVASILIYIIVIKINKKIEGAAKSSRKY